MRVLLFAVALQLFAYFLPGATWNPVSRYGLSRALVTRGSLTIDATAAATGDRARRDGHWYSDKAPLPAMLAVPGLAVVHAFEHASGHPPVRFEASDGGGVVARRLVVNDTFVQQLYACSLTTAGVAGAALVVLIFELLCRRFAPTTALLAALVCVFGSPIGAYATSFYGHVPAALALVAALDRIDRGLDRGRSLGVVGAWLGFAVGCEYVVAVPAAILGLTALARSPLPFSRRLAALIAGALPLVAIVGAYHWLCFGAPWKTGYSFLTNPTFVAGHASGVLGLGLPSPTALVGLLFGASRGLFVIAPVAALGVLGLVAHLVRTRDRVLLGGALAALALLLANAGYYMWWGGAAAGPRHLVPCLPILAIGLAEAWSHARLRAPIAILGLVSLANVLVVTAVGLELPESGDVIFDHAWRAALEGRFATLRGASNLGMRLGLPRAASLGPLVAFAILAARSLVLAARAMRDQRPELGASGTLASCTPESSCEGTRISGPQAR